MNKSQNTLDNTEEDLQKLKEKLALYSAKGRDLSKELHVLRSRKNFRVISLLLGQPEPKKDLPVELHSLYDYSAQTYSRLHSYKLRETNDLGLINAVEYSITLPPRPIKGIVLSFGIDFFSDSGLIRIELLNKNGDIVRWASKSIAKITPYSATKFEFKSISTDELVDRSLILKISAENTDVPIRLREWQRINILRRKIERRPFLGFVVA
jgi:hypothetical protein